MTLKKHSASIFVGVLLSFILVEVSHHYGGFVGEIFVEYSEDVPFTPFSTPEFIEETAKEDYIHSEDIPEVNISLSKANKSNIQLTDCLFEQNVIVPPPDFIL